MSQEPLLTRETFKSKVFARSNWHCVFCPRPAVDAHHILERKLFADGGYRLSNGAAVCEQHHWDCEVTRLTVEEVRRAAGIEHPVIPEGFDSAGVYDKWGNRCWPSGMRSWGPLERDDGARKALAAGGCMAIMMPAAYTETAPAGEVEA
jgi:hypothetical protein